MIGSSKPILDKEQIDSQVDSNKSEAQPVRRSNRASAGRRTTTSPSEVFTFPKSRKVSEKAQKSEKSGHEK